MVESTAITVDHVIVTSSTPSTIPTDGSATLELILVLTSRALALVVDTILPEHQLEVNLDVFILISYVRAIIITFCLFARLKSLHFLFLPRLS